VTIALWSNCAAPCPQSSKKPPPNAYVAVDYRGYWYYIDDRHLASKAKSLLVLKTSRIDLGRRLLLQVEGLSINALRQQVKVDGQG
jgi:hypothetical protein